MAQRDLIIEGLCLLIPPVTREMAESHQTLLTAVAVTGGGRSPRLSYTPS
ncbi:hypothetical protein HRED_01996 [Candidatus Haloredivivus sp. G17]|nr:hypothetical protein HRED_01996 [Candidatus Haloredivivus sp. G17]